MWGRFGKYEYNLKLGLKVDTQNVAVILLSNHIDLARNLPAKEYLPEIVSVKTFF